MPFRVEALDSSNVHEWEKFNNQNSEGSLFHTVPWRDLLEEAFGFATRYLLVYRAGKPVALCPFFKRKFFGFRGFVSLPDPTLNPCDHLVMDLADGALEGIVIALRNIAEQEGRSIIVLGVSEEQKNLFAKLNLPLYAVGGRMVLDLSENPPDRIWTHKFHNNQRNKIRRFDKDGFRLEYGESLDDIASFYSFYETNLLHIGGRPFPISFFEMLLNRYPGTAPDRVMLTTLRGKESIAGGLLGLFWEARKTFYWRYFSLNRRLPNVYTPFYYLLWHAVKDTYDVGGRIVDFGGVDYDPSNVHFRMKSDFGCHFVHKYLTIIPISALTKLVLALKSTAHLRQIPPRLARVQ
jgi:hypothetical protein